MLVDPLSTAALARKIQTPSSISTIGKGFDVAASGGSKRSQKGVGGLNASQPAAGLGLASESIFQQRGSSSNPHNSNAAKKATTRDENAVSMYEGIALVDRVLEDAEVQRRAEAREKAARFKNRVGKIGSLALPVNKGNAAAASDSTWAEGGRGSTTMSSPRENPMLIAKVAVESKSSKLDGFLYSTAASQKNLAPLVQANLSVGETRAQKRRDMISRRNTELADMRRRELAEMTGGGGEDGMMMTSMGVSSGGDPSSLRATTTMIAGNTSVGGESDVYASSPALLRSGDSSTNNHSPTTHRGGHINALVDQSHLIHLAAHELVVDATQSSPMRGIRPRGYADDTSCITTKDARLKVSREEALTDAIAHASTFSRNNNRSKSPPAASSGNNKRLSPSPLLGTSGQSTTLSKGKPSTAPVGGFRSNSRSQNQKGGGISNTSNSGFAPGSSLAGLVDCKERLTRSSILDSRRKFTSSFGAPPRPELLRQTCAPAHASYQVKYSEVERRPTGSHITPVPTTASKMRQRLDGLSSSNNTSVISSIHAPSAAVPTTTTTNGAVSSSPNNTTNNGFFLTSTGHAQTNSDILAGTTTNRNLDRTVSFQSERSGMSGGLGSTTMASTSPLHKGNIIPGEVNHDDVRAKAAHAMQNTTIPDPSLLTMERESTDYIKREDRSYAAPFKSGVQRSHTPTSLDLSYYPLVEPGITTYGPGRIIGNARDREYTPYGKPCGANTTYNLDLVDEAQRKRYTTKKTIDFSKGISRDQNGAFSGVGSVDTSQLSYKDQRTAVMKRSGGTSVAMSRQVGRPEVQRAATTEPPEMEQMDNTMSTATKRGFVDFSRATNYPTRSLTHYDELREMDTRPPLDISDACISRQAPAVSFTKGSSRDAPVPQPRAHSSMASLGGSGGGMRGGTDPHYLTSQSRISGGSVGGNASSIVELAEGHNHLDGIGSGHDSPVHRRAPAVAFPRTSRETAPISRTPVPGDYSKGSTAASFPARHMFYDVKENNHIPSAVFGPLVSREQREKTLTQRYASTDAVYDSMPKDKPKLIIGFEKVPPRK